MNISEKIAILKIYLWRRGVGNTRLMLRGVENTEEHVAEIEEILKRVENMEIK